MSYVNRFVSDLQGAGYGVIVGRYLIPANGYTHPTDVDVYRFQRWKKEGIRGSELADLDFLVEKKLSVDEEISDDVVNIAGVKPHVVVTALDSENRPIATHTIFPDKTHEFTVTKPEILNILAIGGYKPKKWEED